MNEPELISLSYSPWSEKARWALDHAGVSYREREYLPMLGELGLRIRTRRPLDRVTVPCMIAGSTVYPTSFHIAHYAHDQAPERGLFPAGRERDVSQWDELSERALRAGRIRRTRRVLSDRAALRENVPSPLDKLGPLSTVLAVSGARFLLTKYEGDAFSEERCSRELRLVCQALRDGLKRAEGDYLLGELSYADMTIALGLQFVDPVANRWLPLGERSRPHWRDPSLAEEFSELIRWRDRLFERHRRPSEPPTSA